MKRLSHVVKNITKVSGLTSSFYPHLENTEIPRLPVPTIEETLERYKKCIEPLVTPEKYKESLEIIEAFEKNDAEVLQQDLLQLAEETPTSYLEGFWDTMYMTYGMPNPVNVNPYFIVGDFTDDYIKATAAALCASAKFHHSIHFGYVEHEKEPNGTPLCMSQYRNLFSSGKVPYSPREEFVKYLDSKHAVIVRNGVFYKIDLFDDDWNVLPTNLIEEQVKMIAEDANKNPSTCPVGALTTQWRDVWAEQRAQIIENETNAKGLETIDSAILVLNMYNEECESLEDFSKILCTTDGKSCWFDKFQVFVTNEGRVGFNMEHSGFDGHTILQLGTKIRYNEEVTGDIKGVDLEKGWERINFEENEVLLKSVETAIENYAWKDSCKTSLCDFNEYGKKFIKKCKVSPDAFVQMCYQLTYYQLFREMGSVYESCLTKKWFHGRTSTIRSTSPETKKMCEVFFEKESTNEEKIEAFRKACETQVVKSIEAREGRDVDRHLYALMHLAKLRQIRFPGYDIPELFKDPSYGAMKYDNMSTSNCGSDDIILFGFGPTFPKGFGIGYVINNDRLCINVTSFVGEEKKFRDTLFDTFMMIKETFESQM